MRLGVLLPALMLTAVMTAGCNGGSDAPPSPLESTLTNQKVCGLLTPKLVTSIVGHDNISVRGSGIAGPAKRAGDTIDCSIVDRDRDKTPLLVIVSDKTTADERAAATTMLDDELTAKANCSAIPAEADLGAGYVCEDVVGPQGPGYFYINALLAERLVRLTYQAAPTKVGDGLITAITLVKDVDANVEAYDRKHSEG